MGGGLSGLSSSCEQRIWLDMIISLGYRVKSAIATHFRRWATERLKEAYLETIKSVEKTARKKAGDEEA